MKGATPMLRRDDMPQAASLDAPAGGRAKPAFHRGHVVKLFVAAILAARSASSPDRNEPGPQR
jgi:hypothetical protein